MVLGILLNHSHSSVETKSVSSVCVAFVRFVSVSLFFRILAYVGWQSTVKSGDVVVVVSWKVESFSIGVIRINGLQRVSSCLSFGSFKNGT